MLYSILDIGQGYKPNERFNYKDHKALTKHQITNANMQEELLRVIAPSKPDELINYLNNFQRLWMTLNSSCFETEVEQIDGEEIYWQYFFAPMLARLLCNISCTEEDPLYHIAQYIRECDITTSNMTSWVKDTIVEAIGIYNISTPNFKSILQDIRNDRDLKFETIAQHISELRIDITNSNLQKKELITLELSAKYKALLLIKKIAGKGYKKQLTTIQSYLNEFNLSPRSELISQHITVFQTLIQNHSSTIINVEHPIIKIFDKYILDHIKPSYPRGVDYFEDTYYPDIKQLEKSLSIIYNVFCHDNTPLSLALFKYYKMLYTSQHENFKKAYDLYLEVKELSKQVHLGAYNATNNMYGIVLHWQIHHKFTPNQFQSEITELIQTLPDEVEFTPILNHDFKSFIESLDDYEKMMFKAFKRFNEAQDLGVYADPFYKLTELIKTVINICNNNPDDDLSTLENKLKKELPSSIVRSHNAIGFSKKLS